mmetsp:Transcript_14714/g.33787  ORF Transcript_14714/g.33787 Transcript_14714/m.33787 type:complete len:288 (+) Transcript_14714:386-1249(+)
MVDNGKDEHLDTNEEVLSRRRELRRLWVDGGDLGDDVQLHQDGDGQRLPERKEDDGFDRHKFPQRLHGGQLLAEPLVEQDEAVKSPGLTEVCNHGSPEEALRRLQTPLSPHAQRLQDECSKRAGQLDDDILNDSALDSAQEQTRIMMSCRRCVPGLKDAVHGEYVGHSRFASKDAFQLHVHASKLILPASLFTVRLRVDRVGPRHVAYRRLLPGQVGCDSDVPRQEYEEVVDDEGLVALSCYVDVERKSAEIGPREPQRQPRVHCINRNHPQNPDDRHLQEGYLHVP